MLRRHVLFAAFAVLAAAGMARAGLWQWDDKLRTDRDAVSFQYVAGVGYKLWARSRVFADFEHDMNRISGQRFRGMLWLSLAVNK